MSKKNPSWGGRFTKKPSQIAQNFSSSVDVDQALYSQDIQGSIAYAEALMEAKVPVSYTHLTLPTILLV